MPKIPTVHLNGTSGEDLLRQQLDVARACAELLGKLGKAAPHGRDYYVQDPDAINVAMKEQEERYRQVAHIMLEAETIALKIEEQLSEKRRISEAWRDSMPFPSEGPDR